MNTTALRTTSFPPHSRHPAPTQSAPTTAHPTAPYSSTTAQPIASYPSTNSQPIASLSTPPYPLTPAGATKNAYSLTPETQLNVSTSLTRETSPLPTPAPFPAPYGRLASRPFPESPPPPPLLPKISLAHTRPSSTLLIDITARPTPSGNPTAQSVQRCTPRAHRSPTAGAPQ
jgi:hypothetical protein